MTYIINLEVKFLWQDIKHQLNKNSTQLVLANIYIEILY